MSVEHRGPAVGDPARREGIGDRLWVIGRGRDET